jgi:hypothetical protein
MADKTVQQIGYRILKYLVENPQAQDTLEGIVEWWLLDRLTMSNVNKVKEALAHLVAAHLLLARKGKESRTYYKINSHKLKEISERLETVSQRK